MDLVQEQFDRLKACPQYAAAILKTVSNGTHIVEIPEFQLPAGWSRSKTTVYFVVPVGYPQARPDTFWSDPGLTLTSGATPQSTGANQPQGLPAGLLWFSWHPRSWNPNADSLSTYARFIAGRFQERR